jgi:hypothetical protein
MNIKIEELKAKAKILKTASVFILVVMAVMLLGGIFL